MEKLNHKFIKERRNELGISLQEMAYELGFKNASTYMKYENGTYAFKANHVPVIAKKLKCRINDIYFFSNNVAKTAR
ncbi:helix-turn-helix transcriptional regulator [Thalassobacillus sp. C254]|uniref:helix-turn-helix transcriptional regulator n=1 Tax=Thalassobacillus sp. C254 TaxID=1225341 RepID=UPI0006D25CDD|nr:helix-turn-helix transcriptional regulator [Thalassobacillus sp. C254]